MLGKASNSSTWIQDQRKDYSKSNDDPGKTVKNNCANIKDIQCESIRTGEVLSMWVVSVNFRHKNSGKEIMAFAMLDTRSQGTFITTSLMEQLNISGIQTFINIKILIVRQKESLYRVEGLVLAIEFEIATAILKDFLHLWCKDLI